MTDYADFQIVAVHFCEIYFARQVYGLACCELVDNQLILEDVVLCVCLPND